MIPAEWNLSGKRALITADSREWTPYLAGALAEFGADVAIAGWETEHITKAVQEVKAHGRHALEITTDLNVGERVKEAVANVVDLWGGLDILVNNAQAQFAKPFLDVSEKEWDSLMGYNLRSAFLLCKEAGQQMISQGSGRIINIISGLAERGLWNSVAYCASQGAMLQLTRALGLEWAHSGIRVNAIAAGWIATQEHPDNDALAKFIPMRRLGHPRELAPLLVYLASDACDFVTGQSVFVDGGAAAHA